MQCVMAVEFCFKQFLIGLIWTYKTFLSPALHFLSQLVGFSFGCKYPLNCSEFSIDTIQTHRLPRAILKIFGRLLSCGPWNTELRKRVKNGY